MNAIRNMETANARPLSARSLIASLLLGMRRPERSGAELVRWCGLFGVPAGTARVALSRMVDAGELRAAAGRYELVGRVRARGREHEVARRPPVRREWDGTWVIAVVTADARSSESRAALRAEFRRAHYAEQREGVWTRPDNLVVEKLAERDTQCRLWRGAPDGDAIELAEALFAPGAWNARAVELDAWLQRATAALDPEGTSIGPAISDSFLAGTRALAHLRADPMLPDVLLPGGWRGDELRRTYDAFQPRFSDAVAAWFHTSRPS